tara:strand:- start:7900 stop:8625 length:726 start_codon:yes stop_codon:yes gene_type:complete
MSSYKIKALYFDVFGTVADWYSSVTREGQELSGRMGHSIPWGEFVTKWRVDGYLQALGEISSGNAKIIPTETIHRNKLVNLLNEYGLTSLSNDEIDHFNRVWNRLDTWEDAREGLLLLKKDFMILPFSNGDFRCLLDISRRNDLPWDGIISADFFKKVKPDPTIYYDAAELVQLDPPEIMMVACHAQDLMGARNAGFRTAYVNRPYEYGPDAIMEDKPVSFDYDVDSITELAKILRDEMRA